VRQALRFAIQLQAGKYSTTATTSISTATTKSTATTSISTATTKSTATTAIGNVVDEHNISSSTKGDSNDPGSSGSNDDKNDSKNRNSDNGLIETSTDRLPSVGTNTIPSLIPSNPLPSTTTSTSTSTSTNKAQIVLSQWALDTAFSTILKVPTPRMGRPAVRKIDEILSMVTDKHEKSLVGNVISPQDIGVTYDMIGKFVIIMRSVHDVHIVPFLCI